MARTIAAALTPLRANGAELDDDALQPYLIFLRDAGVDGILLHGTTGEGILLSFSERKRAISNAVTGPLPVLAHCGAQSTADTAALAAYAAEAPSRGSPPRFRRWSSRRCAAATRTRPASCARSSIASRATRR